MEEKKKISIFMYERLNVAVNQRSNMQSMNDL